MLQYLQNKRLFSPRLFPLYLLLFIFIVYGHQFFRMGIYWDDWQAILLSNIDKPGVFWNYYIFDRPISIWTYTFPLPLLQNHPHLWQIYGILARWFAGFGLWVFLKGMFPNRSQESAWISLIWSVFPGFFSQSASVTYCQHFVTNGLFNFSLAAMVWSQRLPHRKILFTTLGAMSALLSMLTMEYFAGLELLRPVVLFILLESRNKRSLHFIWQVLKKWSPYLLAVLGFGVYRFWFLDRLNSGATGNRPDFLLSFFSQPLQMLTNFLQMVIQDVVHMLAEVWVTAISPATIDLSSFFYLFSWAAAVALAMVLYFVITNWESAADRSPDRFISIGFALSIFAILFGGLPVWGIGRQAIDGMWSDRFTIAPMMGVSILVVVFWKWIAWKKNSGNFVLAGILALAIAFQLRDVNRYQNNWLDQERFYRQAMWRAPSIEEGTAILSATMPFGFVSEYSIWFAFNTIYGQRMTNEQLPYVYLSALRHRFYQITDFKENEEIMDVQRSLSFHGSTNNSLVFYEAPYQRCIWFVNPDDAALPGLDEDYDELFRISNLNRINTEEKINNKAVNQIFGEETDSDHNWCYYYQRAELAAQYQQWTEVEKIMADAENAGQETEHGRELFPFIEAAAHLNNWDQVESYVLDVQNLTERMEPRTCLLLQKIMEETPESERKETVLTGLNQTLACK